MSWKNTLVKHVAPSTWSFVALALTLCLVTATAPTAALAETPNVMNVEEDWELVLAAPSTAKTAPQLETVISPVGNLASIFARTTWNYREQPDFRPGGMQLQAWNGDMFITKTNFGTEDLSIVSETINWTQSISTDGAILTLKISNGRSTTWGNFGGTSLTLQGLVYLPNLNGYSTDVSVANSGITFGANRVVLLRITEVRRYGPDGVLISKDTTPRVVYEMGQ